MRHVLLTVVCSVGLLAAQSWAAAPTSKSEAGRNAGDATSAPVGLASAATAGSVSASAFVMNAARSDMYEIEAGKLAQERASSDKIKQFAGEMVRDHTMTTEQLKGSLPKGINPPTKLDKRRSGLLDDLRNSKPGEFDKRYVAQQVVAHKEAVTLMEGFAKRGDNDKLKQFASQTAPKIRMHLEMAQGLTPNARKD